MKKKATKLAKAVKRLQRRIAWYDTFTADEKKGRRRPGSLNKKKG